jgi:sensor histidine kinase YesM
METTKNKIKFNFTDWLISSAMTFVFYEVLWDILVIHAWNIDSLWVYTFDFLYCGLFVATSMILGQLLALPRFTRTFTLSRQLVLALVVLAFNLILAYLFEYTYEVIIPFDTQGQYDGGIYLFCFIATMLTSTHNARRYYYIIVNQQEQLLSLKKQVLKSKLDPHFVFNSLSVLTELIHVNQDQAEHYCICLSRIYRNVLSSIDKEYEPVTDAIENIKDYVELQQYRVEGSISLNIKGVDTPMDEYLFPLSLQNIVENAIKHNTPHRGTCLWISITKENNELVVTNNIISDSSHNQSFGIGLKTLFMQYEMENQPQPKITYSDHVFEIRIPILN